MMNWRKAEKGREWMETKGRAKERCYLAAEWETEAGSLVRRQVGQFKGRSETRCPLGLCHIRGLENQCSQGTSLLARDDA